MTFDLWTLASYQVNIRERGIMNINSILDNIGKVIVGKEDVTQKVLTSILAGGHVLLEDVPEQVRLCLQSQLQRA